jgi:hypothetical protein
MVLSLLRNLLRATTRQEGPYEGRDEVLQSQIGDIRMKKKSPRRMFRMPREVSLEEACEIWGLKQSEIDYIVTTRGESMWMNRRTMETIRIRKEDER